MHYTRRHTGVALGAVLFILLLAVVGLRTLLSTPALALTDEQEQALTDYAERSTASGADSAAPSVHIYLPERDTYIIANQTIYTLSDLRLGPTVGNSPIDSIHEDYTEMMIPAYRGFIERQGVDPDDICLVCAVYSSEGNIIYLNIDGTDLSLFPAAQ